MFYNDAWYLDVIQNNSSGWAPSDVKAEYGVDIKEQWAKVEAKRAELHKIVRELEDCVNAEMRG